MKRHRVRRLTPAEKKAVHAPPQANAGAGWSERRSPGRLVDDRLDDFDVRQRLAEDPD